MHRALHALTDVALLVAGGLELPLQQRDVLPGGSEDHDGLEGAQTSGRQLTRASRKRTGGQVQGSRW